MHAAQITELMAPFYDDPTGFAALMKIKMPPAAHELLERISYFSDGGLLQVRQDTLNERTIVLGAFWWLLRREGSLVLMSVPHQQGAVVAMAMLNTLACACDPRIAEHVTFPRWNRMKIAGHAGWGVSIIIGPSRGDNERTAPHLAAVEFGVEQLARPLVPVQPGALRISTWEGGGGATS